MRKIIGLIALGLLISGCDMAMAETISNGEIRFAFSDIAITNDWEGKEKDSMVYGVVVDYTAQKQIKNLKWILTTNIDYSEQSIQGENIAISDNVRNKIEKLKDCKNNVKMCVAIKDLRHIKTNSYATYYKFGISKDDSFGLSKDMASTTPIRVVYNTKVSGSYKKSNSAIDRKSFGILTELDLIAKRGNWYFRIQDADIFISGLHKNNFEIPLSLEYSPKLIFISYNVLIRGNNKQAGFLRTIKTGIKYNF